jgi:bidirectional [NiFe] hydrogenase diaphorase subunit
MKLIDLDGVAAKELAAQRSYRCRVMCCGSTACLSSGAAAAREALERGVKEAGLEGEIQVVSTGCMGLCSHGPIIRVKPRDEASTLYHDADAELGERIAKEHLAASEVIKGKTLAQDIPFFTRQMKIVLANAGEIDPERIEDYIARGGYRALKKTLTEMTPEEVCEEIIRSGLRGRGGAGYPTGRKWEMLRNAPSETKYVIANGDEGDPGAYMDRSVMEDDPHRILEGMAIAGYAVGAQHGYIYVRAEYPQAVRRLEGAIRAAKRHGLLGKGILGSSFNFDLEVRIGAGAFVCGEETALMASIEGKRGMPRVRPPYPIEAGLFGKPTMINNVETLANVPPIIDKGALWFASLGTKKSRGTKVFALAGKLKNTGLIEVPMGVTLREIVYDIGGGIPDGRAFKAAQTGGPSGGCIPAEYLDTPVDYESLQALGSIMGSGGLIVIDDHSCMVDVAKFFMAFCVDESCGKCIPCRVGTVEMHELLERISRGEAKAADMALLEELCDMVKHTSLCGLGQSAPNPVLSTLRYFRDEYEAHLDGRCPAGICTMKGKGEEVPA